MVLQEELGEKALIERVRGAQRERGLTDEQLAAQLGVHRSLWNLTRRGKRPLRYKIARGIMRAFPELRMEMMIFLARNATVGSNFQEDMTENRSGEVPV